MTTLEFFDIYAAHGLQVIPLHPSSKIPVWRQWNSGWDAERCRSYLLDHPDANIGVLLGTLVDVEGDTEQANELLNDLIGSYPHPYWRSSKSTHHLFVNPDPRLTSTRFLGIEFRAHRHQSVLPPSRHEAGSAYFWQKLYFPVPPMPPPLVEYYTRNRPPYPVHREPCKAKAVRDGVILTQCNKCCRREKIHKKRLLLEVKAFAELGSPWQCHGCRQVDLRPACRRIRTLMRRVLTVPQVGRKKQHSQRNFLVG